MIKIFIMEQKLLLPHKCKKIGWCVLLPFTLFGIILIAVEFDSTRFYQILFFWKEIDSLTFFGFTKTNTVVGTLFLIGAMLVSFSQEKIEDEYIANLRLSSLLWALLVSHGLLLIAFLFVYGIPFLNVMMYNMFTTLIIFIIRFNYILSRDSRSAGNEK